MKLKYYLRGLGIGIVITAAVMSFTRQPEKLTDAQIKARARELGMVEKSVLADLKNEEELTYEENTVEEQETSGESITAEAEKNENSEEEDVGEEPTVEEFPNDVNEEKRNDVINETESNSGGISNEINFSQEKTDEDVENYIVISVVGGNGSEIVSRKLFEAGLVDSEVEYNRFLIENGYDKKLRAGNHEIPVGATEEEMAKILCDIN